MKKYSLISLFAAAALMASCSLNPDTTNPSETEDIPQISLYNEIEQVVTTRVNDNGFCDGDGVGVYVVNYTDEGTSGTLAVSGNQADNVEYTYNDTTGAWTPATEVYYRDRKTHVDIIGYYPYSSPGSVTEYEFEVAKDQSTDAANGMLGGYEASDFLWAKAADITPTESRIALKFGHRMAGVQVSLIEGTGFDPGEFATLKKELLVNNVIRTSTIDLATGEITPVGEVPATGIVPAKNGEDFRAVVVPQSILASTSLFSITVDGTAYDFRKDENFTYYSGRLHKFSISISKKSLSGLEFTLLGESITAWETDNITHDATAREYIIIDCPTPGTLKDCITAAGKDYTKVKNLKVTGTIDARDFYMMRDEMTALQSINLKEVSIAECTTFPANEIPDNAFSGKLYLIHFIFPDNITAIGASSFQGTNLSGSLIIPNTVTEIKNSAFSGVATLNGTLTLSKQLEVIGNSAFTGCSFIKTLEIPSSVKIIESAAFSNNDFTGNLILPKDLEVLGSSAFAGCEGFTGSLEIPKKIKQIENSTFVRCGFNGTLILHDDITRIGDGAFQETKFSGALHLPNNLLIIENGAFYRSRFSGTLKLPKSLTVLHASAFFECGFSGIVEIPEGITAIGERTFYHCSQLEGVILHKDIESIGSDAFYKCTQISSIVCKALNPPVISSTAFSGVAKDNFTVEVPEEAVANYSTAPGWNEFKRFAAHRDFSISRNLFRALNASVSRTFVLRAPSGEAWSVESAPEWVSVTPASGTGKTNVTITIDGLNAGGAYREGEVVFLLDGKDYRSRTKVEQYNYEYGDGDVKTWQTATVGNGVDLVFMGDCFDAKDISEGKYLSGVEEAIGYFFDIEPYKTYKEYFNVYIVFGLSPESGVGDVNTIREAKFGSAYALGGITPDEAICYEYACKAPTVTESTIHRTLITLVENTEDYGGICYMWGDGSAIAVCPMSRDAYPYDFRGLVQHEAGGHGFAKLGDEYIYYNSFIQTCTSACNVATFNTMKERGWYENLSLSGNMYDVPWSHMIFDPKYSNVVDIYEGGYMHSRGVFRSEANSCMNNNIPYYSAISRETIVKNIMKYAGEDYSYEAFKAKDVMTPATTTMDATRAGETLLEYSASNKQFHPVYMGDKPRLKK